VEGLEQAEQQFEATLRKAYIYPGETVQIQRFRVDKFKEET
jgi:AMMECR1 domain-containing protein